MGQACTVWQETNRATAEEQKGILFADLISIRCHPNFARPKECSSLPTSRPLSIVSPYISSLEFLFPLYSIGYFLISFPALRRPSFSRVPPRVLPFAMELCGRQKVVQRKMVLLSVSLWVNVSLAESDSSRGDGACGKTSALNVFTRG